MIESGVPVIIGITGITHHWNRITVLTIYKKIKMKILSNERFSFMPRVASIVFDKCVMLAVAAMVIDIVYISHVLPYRTASFTFLDSQPNGGEGGGGYDHDDHFVRTAVYQTVAYMAISISLLALHPTRAQACYLRTAALTYLFFAILLGCSDAANATQFFSGAHGQRDTILLRGVLAYTLL
ncbi:hypothetical protein T492DRAFT_839872 [Pavlovales sp. CCMP2436]|nr:hypothetical protein T492DRAFT_839872 [Pavlovales sp. CCMP2436]